MKKVSIVIPAYNEEKNIEPLVKEVKRILKTLPYNYEIIIVDDGSQDKTPEIIKTLSQKDSNIYYIIFNKNYSHQNALRAGYQCSTGDCVITMDADFQNPPELIPQFIKKWENGAKIVVAFDNKKEGLSLFKRSTAKAFYYIINFLSGIKAPSGTADFRLLDKEIVLIINNIKNKELVFRVQLLKLGEPIHYIKYKIQKRLHGETHYTLKKMFKLAFDGIFTSTIKPLFISLALGILLNLVSFFLIQAQQEKTIILFILSLIFIITPIILYLKLIFADIFNVKPIYIIKETNCKTCKNIL